MMPGGRVDTKDSVTPFDVVEIQLQNSLLPEDDLRWNSERQVVQFADGIPARAAEQVLHELLRDRRRSARQVAVEHSGARGAHLVKIKSPMRPEASVFRGNHGVRNILGNPLVSSEGLPLAICTPIEERLDAPLQLNAGNRRFNESIDGEEHQADHVVPGENRKDRLSNPNRSTFETDFRGRADGWDDRSTGRDRR